MTLPDCHIDRRIRVVEPAMRDQPERTGGRRIVAEIDLDIMIARHPLVLPTSESFRSFAVERAQ